MPDIQTALANAINEWSKDEPAQPQTEAPMPTQPFNVTNNVTRTTFEFVRDRPGVHYKAAVNALVARGFKENSITALLSQMRRAGLIVRDTDDRYTAVGKEYVPMKASSKIKPKSVKHFTNKPAKADAWTPPALVPMPPAPYENPAPAPVVTVNDVDYLLNTLPIKQARELYDALHKIFGGGA
jgi:hypothetical protein